MEYVSLLSSACGKVVYNWSVSRLSRLKHENFSLGFDLMFLVLNSRCRDKGEGRV